MQCADGHGPDLQQEGGPERSLSCCWCGCVCTQGKEGREGGRKEGRKEGKKGGREGGVWVAVGGSVGRVSTCLSNGELVVTNDSSAPN